MAGKLEQISYRQARESDLPAICELGQVVNALHHAADPLLFAPESAPERDMTHWRQGCFVADATAYVAEFEGLIIGFVNAILLTESNPMLQPMRFARIGTICIKERYRDQGIGRTLVTKIEDWAKAHGADEIRLNVFAFNERARHLYEDMGYNLRLMGMNKRL